MMRFPATILLFILVPTVARSQKQPAASSSTTTVFCNDRSVCLPPSSRSVCLPHSSIDLALICDVYHHFEFPKQTMESIHHALSDGGRVILIDFERIPGSSGEWTLGHVRAGKQAFIDEVQDAGFELVGERTIAGFQENYFHEFCKISRLNRVGVRPPR